MQIMKYYITLIFLITIFFSCKSVKKNNTKTTTLYFKDFNIFKLEGYQFLDKQSGKEFVKVKYSNHLPIEIIFNYSKRKVKFLFKDSFSYNNKIIYEYNTTNLLGGNKGKTRIYSTHYVANNYQLFIDKSDTIVIKFFDEIDAKDSNYWCSINYYKRNMDGSVYSKTLFTGDVNYDNSHHQQLNYSTWLSYFNYQSNKEYDFKYPSFPPK